MGLLDIYSSLRAARRLDDLVQQVARRAYAPLRAACEPQALAMSQAEARGYVWAKALPIVSAEVETLLLESTSLPSWARITIVARTRDRLTRIVLADLLRQAAPVRQWKRAA